MLELKKAQRKRAKIKIGMASPAGGGKTLGALLIAYGLMKEKYPKVSEQELWDKIAIVDTENGSGELYVGKEIHGIKILEYGVVTMTPPFEAEKYTKSILLCEENGIEVVILDSITHLWAGSGGLLEQQGTIAKRTGNSYTSWREITPMHNRFIDTMLQSDVHIIATMRSKMDYVQEKDPNTGKTVVRKIGMNPIQKDGAEYEMSLFLDIDSDHTAFASKDRTGIYDQQYFKITPEVGMKIMQWLESGTDDKYTVLATEKDAEKEVKAIRDEIISVCKNLGGSKNEELISLLKEYEPTSGNPSKINDLKKLASLKDSLTKFATKTQE